MGRYDNKTVPVSIKQMKDYAGALEHIAWLHNEIANWMHDKDLPTLEMRSFKSATGALADLARFMGAATESVAAALSARGIAELQAIQVMRGMDVPVEIHLRQIVEKRDKHFAAMMEAYARADAASESPEVVGALVGEGEVTAQQTAVQGEGRKPRKAKR